MMDRIIREVERDWIANVHDVKEMLPSPLMVPSTQWDFADAAARSAALMSMMLPLAAIVVFTRDGRTAGLISEYRPRAPIVALTKDNHAANRMAVDWGITPRVEVPPEHLAEGVRMATGLLLREGICQVGDAFALVIGWPVASGTNTVKLHRI
jgi:pyruvate kinase